MAGELAVFLVKIIAPICVYMSTKDAWLAVGTYFGLQTLCNSIRRAQEKKD